LSAGGAVGLRWTIIGFTMVSSSFVEIIIGMLGDVLVLVLGISVVVVVVVVVETEIVVEFCKIFIGFVVRPTEGAFIIPSGKRVKMVELSDSSLIFRCSCSENEDTC